MTTPPTQGQGLPQGPPEPVSATPVPPGAGPGAGAGVPGGAATSTGAVPQVPAGVPAYGAGQQLPPGAGVPGGQVPPGAPGVPTPAGAVPQVPGQVPPGAPYGVGAAQPMTQQPLTAPPAYYNPGQVPAGQVPAGAPAYGAGPGQQAVPGQVLPGAPSAPVPGAGAPLAPQAVGVPVYTPVPAQQPAYYNPPGAPGYPPAVPPSQQPRTWASVTALVLLLVSLVPNVLDLFTAMTYSDRFTPNRSLAGVMVGMLVSTGLVSAVIGVVLAALRRPTGIVLVSALVMVGMYPFDQASLYYSLMGLPSAIVGPIILVLRVTAGIFLLLAGPRGADRCPATVLLSRGAVGAMGLVVLQQVVTLGMTQITLSGLPDEYFATMDFWFSSYLLAPSMFGPDWTRASLYQDIFSVGVAALVLTAVLVLAALVLMVMRRSWVLAEALAALAAVVLLGFNTYVTVARYSASTRSIVVTADVFTVPPLLALVVLGFVLTGLISPRARAWAQARK